MREGRGIFSLSRREIRDCVHLSVPMRDTRWPSTRLFCDGILASWLVLLASTQPARADTSDKPDEEAAKLFHEAAIAANQGRDDKAIALMLAAVARDPQPHYIANLGISEVNAKRYRDGAEHIASYLRTVRTLSDEDRTVLLGMLKEAEEKIGLLTLHVDSPGADIFIDDKHVGLSPLQQPIYVDAGKHKIQILKDDVGHTRIIEVEAGSKPVLEIVVAPPPIATVISTPLVDKPIAPPPNPRNTKIIYAGIASSAILGAVGIGTTIGATYINGSSYEHWLYNGCVRANATCLNAFEEAQGKKSILGTTAIVAFVGSGVIGLATTIYALRGSKKPDPPNVTLTLGPQELGIGWRGSF